MEQIIFVKPLKNYHLEIMFKDGYCKVVDISPYIGDGISENLKDETFFNQVQLDEGGGICWPNGYDFCPNFLRNEVPASSIITA